MIPWDAYSYVPVIRTRDAELKGFREIDPKRLDRLIPVIELTRSRRSKSNPTAAVSFSVEKVREILADRYFIADLTSLDSQTTPEIEEMLDESGGFANWVAYVQKVLGSHAIPVAHLTDPFDSEIFDTQLKALGSTQEAVAIRIPTSFLEIEELMETAQRAMGDLGRVAVLVDAGFVPPSTTAGARGAVLNICKEVASYNPAVIVPTSSSFPSSVVAPGYGEDRVGEFPLCEVDISAAVERALPFMRVLHGDYSCIHPLDFEGTVTAWVPRVDVPLESSLFYYRYRRPVGGYVAAAQAALRDHRYVSLDCWGDENIKMAAAGEPLGKSPAHWIGARLNFHISRQVRARAKV